MLIRQRASFHRIVIPYNIRHSRTRSPQRVLSFSAIGNNLFASFLIHNTRGALFVPYSLSALLLLTLFLSDPLWITLSLPVSHFSSLFFCHVSHRYPRFARLLTLLFSLSFSPCLRFYLVSRESHAIASLYSLFPTESPFISSCPVSCFFPMFPAVVPLRFVDFHVPLFSIFVHYSAASCILQLDQIYNNICNENLLSSNIL